ncbi:hypothetical protein BD410DRAFT_895443 [Rickenella mellea]|uniref:Pre-rRNA processing protein n=1 Tax=Rickenella mellea TaxID=50990 RepID=A0A4Y7QFE9_9AGAM|nr:hypothetical protein BD410DRAFT_895443 [Rickenella mellea]
MEEIQHARVSSGIYHDGYHQFNGSTESLRNRGEAPAGTAITEEGEHTQEGPFGDHHSTTAHAASAAGAGAAGATAEKTVDPNVAWYRRPGWWKSRPVIICQIITALLGIALLFILLFPVVKAIAQLVVKRSNINITFASIKNPTNTSFNLDMEGVVTNTGIFNAKIEFTQPVNVFWVNGDTQKELGSITLDALSAKHKRAYINQTTTFNVLDQAAFGEFTSFMITQPQFKWRLKSGGLKVHALKFPVANGVNFDKIVTLNGINNFNGNVTLLDFQLPSDNPAGGINFYALTQLNNTSPFQIDLGTIVFNLTYKDVFMGTGTGYTQELDRGINAIALNGTLIPHTDKTELAVLSELFTQYLNGQSSPVLAEGHASLLKDNTTVSWLSQGLQNLTLNVPFKAPSAINPIKSIDIGYLNLSFTDASAWSPLSNTNEVQAALELPFGFGLAIGQIENTFNISQNGSTIAALSTPLGASTSSISVLGPTDTKGTINITIINTNLAVPADAHTLFSQFNHDLTNGNNSIIQLTGHSRAVANLSIGQITLDPINFNVPSSLKGLQGLKTGVAITSVDVMGGSTDALQLNIGVDIANPSNLNLQVGDINLQLFRDGGLIGTTLLPNLTLDIGNNSRVAQGQFQANNNAQSRQTLNDFVGKKDVPVSISGYQNSTSIPSLLEAFQSLALNATIPGLKTNLLENAALTVLPTTGHANDMAHVSVNLANPFTAGLVITKISSSVASHGIKLGTIETTTNFAAAGKKTSASPALDFDMNMDPSALFSVTRALAADAGLETDQLDAIVAIGGIKYLATTSQDSAPAVQRRANMFTGFDLPTYVQKAFKGLRSDVSLTSAVTIGDYSTTLDYTQLAVPVVTDDSLNLLLPILAQPIVQKLVSASTLGISTVVISNPGQNSFSTKLSGSITDAGPFDATISFGSGLTISWNGKPLGSIQMPDVALVGDVGGTIDVTADFTVADVDHLTDFTKALLTEPSFAWDIAGENLSISALGIVVPGVSLTTKTVELKGMNGLKDGVKIETFDLPSDDPAGGIHLTLSTTVTNPSQVGIELSSIGFQNFFGSTNLGPVVSQGGFTLAPQSTIQLPLVGRLIPQSAASGLADVSNLFTRFIHGQDSPVTVNGDSAGPSDVTWLNNAIKSLQIQTVLPARGPLDVIKSISLDALELLFTTGTAYDPSTTSNAATAAFQLPFAFPLDIKALEQNITIGFQGQSFAQLNIPKGPSTTDVAARIIHLTFDNVPMTVFGNKHSVFQQFLAATTVADTQSFSLAGSANTDAQTAVGLLSISDINFSVETSIKGLQGLNTKPVVVSNLDVNHGFSDFLLITVSTELFNPSNITIGMGDVAFGLQFEDQSLGTADISNLIVTPGEGNYSTNVHFAPHGGATSAGQTLLQNYIQGVDSSTTIVGSTGSTPIDSLGPALAEIKLSPVNIPAIHQNLITSTSLTFPTDIVKTGVASVTFALSNPFTASINLLKVDATATFHGLTLGTIKNVDLSSSPIHANGHSDITSPTLPFQFNDQPTIVIQLLLLRAQETGVDLGPLVALFQIVTGDPNFNPPIVSSVDPNPPTCVSGQQFDVDSAVLKALAGLQVDLAVKSSLKLDDFATDLTFNQLNVPAVTDQTALFLIGAVAPPVVQKLVDGSTLSFRSANITNISDDGFDLSLSGSLLGTGPLDAQITFVDPVKVTWQGKDIATIALPPVCAAANSGVPDYETKGRLTITDQKAFTEFAVFLLHNPSFDWVISTTTLRVAALGTIFDKVSLTKTVTLSAFNGLPGVTIGNFQLPSDDPAGGIHIETDSLIPSPAQIGIDLGTVSFQSFFNDVLVGPLSGSGLTLVPQASTALHLSGRIVPQSGANLDAIGKLFSAFLAGANQTLVVKGQSVQPSGSSQPVAWLSTAFQSLTLQVTLPGQIFTVIQSITLGDFGVIMLTEDQDFSPLASSNSTVATYKNPFGFSLQVVQASQDITLGANGVDVARLALPNVPTTGGVSTGNPVDLDISFKNVPMVSLNNAAFEQFFAVATDTSELNFQLKGSADVVGRTAIGDVPISGIPFNVPSQLKGINSFNGQASLSNIKITGSGGTGGNEFVVSPLTTVLDNPSTISLQTNNIALPVFFDNVMIGRAAIPQFNQIPGQNTIQSEFHYAPPNANDTVAQSFLTKFLTSGDNIPLTIKGDAASTPFQSLQPAFEGLSLAATLPGLNFPNIISHIGVTITLDSFDDNLVIIDFDVSNPLDTPLKIDYVQSDASSDGIVYASFAHNFDNFVIPAKGTANSGQIPNVFLIQGIDASLNIVGLPLDIAAGQTVEIGVGGYTVPFMKLQQTGVPTDYTFSLDTAFRQNHNTTSSSASKSSTSSSSSTATTSNADKTTSTIPTTSSIQTTPSPAAADPVKATPTPSPTPSPSTSPTPSPPPS